MRTLLFIASFFLFFEVQAQEKWSLEQCVDYALEHNINLKLSELNKEYAKNTNLQNTMELYTPNINTTISESFNFANSVNPLTYQFVQENTNSTTFSLSIDYPIFTGLARIFNLKSSQESLSAAQLENEAIKNQTKLAVINAYLSALLAKEGLKIAEETKTLTQAQDKRTKELVASGVLAKSNIYELEAQLANDQLNLVNAKNSYQLALVQLNNLLQIPVENSIDVQPLNFDEMYKYTDSYSLSSLVSNATQKLPDVNQLRTQLNATRYQLKAAKGGLSPTLSFSAYLGSNYFSAGQEQSGVESSIIPIGYVGGSNAPVFTLYEQPIFTDKNFGNQLKDNFNQRVQLTMVIPIFGKWQRMITINNAKLNLLKANYDISNKESNIAQDVYSAYTNYTAALQQIDASKKNKDASKIAYDYGVEKLEAGTINSYEFETVKNRFLSAQVAYTQAQYELYFKHLILQYYNTGTFNY